MYTLLIERYKIAPPASQGRQKKPQRCISFNVTDKLYFSGERDERTPFTPRKPGLLFYPIKKLDGTKQTG